MDSQSKPNFGEIREKYNLSQEELEAHWKATSYYSEHNTKALDSIPQEKRDRIAQYYKQLRSIGILMYSPTKFYYSPIFPEPSGQVEKITRSNCKPGECNTCHVRAFPEKTNCEIRSHEWQRGINAILSKKRTIEEGQQIANELIYFMNHEFMKA